jgi:hypothetical protein
MNAARRPKRHIGRQTERGLVGRDVHKCITHGLDGLHIAV